MDAERRNRVEALMMPLQPKGHKPTKLPLCGRTVTPGTDVHDDATKKPAHGPAGHRAAAYRQNNRPDRGPSARPINLRIASSFSSTSSRKLTAPGLAKFSDRYASAASRLSKEP